MSGVTGPIGVAVGPDWLTAVIGGECRRVPPDELPALLAELVERVPPRRRRLAVALLPPLVELKRIEFPPLPRADTERVLARDVERYFLRGSDRRVVSAERMGKRGTLWAASAPADLIDQLHADAEREGWRIASVVPAHAAWVAAASASRHGASAIPIVVVVLPTAIEVLGIEGGRLAWLRRLQPAVDPVAAAREAVAGGGPGIRLGDDQQTPDEIAARFACSTARLDLVPDARLASARRRVTAAARALAGAAAALTLLAAGLEWWGTDRELRQVLVVRRAHAAQVAEAMAVRSGLEVWSRRLAVLEAAEHDRIQWAGVLATLAQYLPADAHLRALRGTGDSLLLEGLASRATASFEALQQAPEIQGVRATAPIQREAADSGPARERFVLSARLRPTGGAAP